MSKLPVMQAHGASAVHLASPQEASKRFHRTFLSTHPLTGQPLYLLRKSTYNDVFVKGLLAQECVGSHRARYHRSPGTFSQVASFFSGTPQKCSPSAGDFACCVFLPWPLCCFPVPLCYPPRPPSPTPNHNPQQRYREWSPTQPARSFRTHK